MIEVVFDFAGERIGVYVIGNTIKFQTKQYGGMESPIEGLKLDRKGVEKEHPDLIGKDNWREEAIKRFKEKITSYPTEMERIMYVVNDLSRFGYVPMFLVQAGYRVKKYNVKGGCFQ